MKLFNSPLKHETKNLMHRLDTQNRGIQSSNNEDGTKTYEVGGKGSLMQAFFASQLDGGGGRKPAGENLPGGAGSNYSTNVLEKQYDKLSNAYENNSNLTTSQKEAIGLQMQLNQAIQSSNTDGDNKVTMSEWQTYIQENANENGKLSFTC